MDKDQLFSELQALGEAEVRVKLARGDYQARKTPLILEWLRQQEEARSTGHIAEELRLAREANDIATAANGIAQASNRMAVWSLIVSLVALVLAVLGYAT